VKRRTPSQTIEITQNSPKPRLSIETQELDKFTTEGKLDFNNIRIYIYPEDKIPRDEWKMETIKL
jgi:hypothetical protein